MDHSTNFAENLRALVTLSHMSHWPNWQELILIIIAMARSNCGISAPPWTGGSFITGLTSSP